MSPQEATRNIKQLFRITDDLKNDIKGVRDEQVKQGLTLTEIKADTKQIALILSGPSNRCVEYGMRIKAAEERLDDMDERHQCAGCQNADKVASLVEFRKIWEPRLWMGFGIVIFLQLALTLGPKLLK